VAGRGIKQGSTTPFILVIDLSFLDPFFHDSAMICFHVSPLQSPRPSPPPVTPPLYA
jgi:hypothetical protein